MPSRTCLVLAACALLAAGAASAQAKPPRTGFERTPTAGLAAAKKAGAPKVVRTAAAEGTKALRLARSRRPQWVQHRYRPQAKRLAVSFSYKRTRRGRQIILSLPANKIQIADTGTGKLLLMRPRKPARVIAQVKRAGSWNRLKVIVDAKRNRMRFVPNGRTRTRWQKTPLRPEAGMRFGAPDMRNGPVFYDAVNLSLPATAAPLPANPDPRPAPEVPEPAGTVAGVSGARWTINGRLTYPGTPAEGTLQSLRAAQAIFDDENPETRRWWAYPDTGVWDPERNVGEFLAMLPRYREAGITMITISLMGGTPYRRELGAAFGETTFYGTGQPQRASGFSADGTAIKPAWADRAARVIDAADRLGMIVNLEVLYWGQYHLLTGTQGQFNAVRTAASWVRDNGWRSVVLELSNESNNNNVHELYPVAKRAHPDLLVGTAMSPVNRFRFDPSWWEIADFTFLHANGRTDEEIRGDVAAARALTDAPLHVNEDSHWRITQSRFDMLNALGVGNGYYDQEGYQSPPVDWSIASGHQRAFFAKVAALGDP